MIEIDVPQGDPEWFKARIANPGASSFKRIVTTTGARSSDSARQKYLNELFDEYVLQRKTETFQSKRMSEGIEAEATSRAFYEFRTGYEVRQTGLCYKDGLKKYHASPDGLIVGEKGGFETKDASPHIQWARLKKGGLPTDHFTQCQGSILVCNYDWWDFQSYCENMETLTVRVHPDDKFLVKLEKELNEFCAELAAMISEFRRS